MFWREQEAEVMSISPTAQVPPLHVHVRSLLFGRPSAACLPPRGDASGCCEPAWLWAGWSSEPPVICWGRLAYLFAISPSSRHVSCRLSVPVLPVYPLGTRAEGPGMHPDTSLQKKKKKKGNSEGGGKKNQDIQSRGDGILKPWK